MHTKWQCDKLKKLDGVGAVSNQQHVDKNDFYYLTPLPPYYIWIYKEATDADTYKGKLPWDIGLCTPKGYPHEHPSKENLATFAKWEFFVFPNVIVAKENDI